MMARYAMAGAAALIVMAWLAKVEKAVEIIGANAERARVEKVEKKIDAKIARAQRAIARQPAAGVLDRWSTD